MDLGGAEEALPLITEPTGTTFDATDPRGDIRQQGPDDETRMRLKPEDPDGDITAVRIVHATDHVYLRLDLTQLNKPRRDGTTGQQGTRYTYYVFLGLNRAPEATPGTRGWTLRTGAGHHSGPTKLWYGDAGRNTYCDGVIGQFDYELAEVRISIPRECLENPDWVEANIAFETYQLEPRYTYSEDHWPRYEYAKGGWSPRAYAP